MPEFGRRGHYRTNAYGTTFWVTGHVVNRDDWTRGQPPINLRKADAISFLHRHLARTISGCYAIPNARCPVCREPVFFYANRFGSRVFFDELGPPWTKHPCTENPRTPVDQSPVTYRPPKSRKPGDRVELLEKARIAGFAKAMTTASDSDQWHLLVVNSVLREKEQYTVICECITVYPSKEVRFKIISHEPVFDVGDFVNKRGAEFSFFHRDSMTGVNFRNGERIRLAVQEGSLPVSGRRISQSANNTKAVKRSPPAPKKKYLGLLTVPEIEQLVGDGSGLEEMCSRLKPVVDELWDSGATTLMAISGRLNDLGHLTAGGAQWTPRLTAVLIALVRGTVLRLPKLAKVRATSNKASKIVSKPKPSHTVVVVKKLAKIMSPKAREALTKRESARQLEKLGRVTLSGE